MLTSPTLTLDLPAGYSARPARLDDTEAIVAALNAASQALLGANQHSASDWQRELQIMGFDPETDTRVIFAPDGSVAAFGAVYDFAPHVQVEHFGQVHPAHLGRGLGSDLMRWIEARAERRLPEAPPGARVSLLAWVNSLDTPSHALLGDWSYSLVRHNLNMVLDLDAPPPAPVWPAGVSVRTFVPGPDDRETRWVLREAFRDHWGYVDSPFEEDLERWRSFHLVSPDFDPSLWFLAVAGDAIVGTSFCKLHSNEDPAMGWIYSLGVLRPWRRQGVALALLQQCFGELYRRGQHKAALGVDAQNLTGATRLYEKAGMRPNPKRQYQIWEKIIRDGTDLAVQKLE